MAKLRATIAELEAILGDDGQAARRHQGPSWARSASKFATPRRAEITFDPGDIDIEDLIDDEELVVTMTQGRLRQDRRRPTPSAPRAGAAAAWPGAKLKDEDYVTQHRPHHRPRLPAVLLQPGPGLPAQGPRDPDEGAHGPGHGHRQPAAAGARRAIQADHRHPRLRDRAATCSSPPRRARSRRRASPSTTRRRRDGLHRHQPQATATSWCGSSRPAATTTSSWSAATGMTIRFSEDDVRPMGRSAAGCASACGCGPDDEVVSCDVARDDADILIVTDAGYGKRTQLDKFNRKGRGGQGVQGHQAHRQARATWWPPSWSASTTRSS